MYGKLILCFFVVALAVTSGLWAPAAHAILQCDNLDRQKYLLINVGSGHKGIDNDEVVVKLKKQRDSKTYALKKAKNKWAVVQDGLFYVEIDDKEHYPNGFKLDDLEYAVIVADEFKYAPPRNCQGAKVPTGVHTSLCIGMLEFENEDFWHVKVYVDKGKRPRKASAKQLNNAYYYLGNKMAASQIGGDCAVSEGYVEDDKVLSRAPFQGAVDNDMGDYLPIDLQVFSKAQLLEDELDEVPTVSIVKDEPNEGHQQQFKDCKKKICPLGSIGFDQIYEHILDPVLRDNCVISHGEVLEKCRGKGMMDENNAANILKRRLKNLLPEDAKFVFYAQKGEQQ